MGVARVEIKCFVDKGYGNMLNKRSSGEALRIQQGHEESDALRASAVGSHMQFFGLGKR